MNTETDLDLKVLVENFEDLEVGHSFEVVHHRDPQSLLYVLNVEKPEEFSWDYLEKGPAQWRVRISRVAEPAEAEGGCCGCCG